VTIIAVILPALTFFWLRSSWLNVLYFWARAGTEHIRIMRREAAVVRYRGCRILSMRFMMVLRL